MRWLNSIHLCWKRRAALTPRPSSIHCRSLWQGGFESAGPGTKCAGPRLAYGHGALLLQEQEAAAGPHPGRCSEHEFT